MATDKEILDNLKKKIPAPNVEGALAETKELPDIDMPEYYIEVDGKIIEIKPTKLHYFRNNSVALYKLLDTIPLPDLFRFTEERNGLDGDAAVLTFISAVLDDARLAKRIYDKMDAATLMDLVEIFKKVNKIDVREEKSKNVVAAKAKG